MTVIRVNPTSVRNYGTTAQTCFNDMRTALVQVVDQVANVHYFGPNATMFKQNSGQVAALFANKLSQDMKAMATAVQDSTSSIASALGGEPLTITVETSPISPPDVPTVDYVDLDTSALAALGPLIGARFSDLEGVLERNLRELSSTDWSGTAKDSAVEKVRIYTVKSVKSCEEAKESLQKFISDQLVSVLAADKK